MLLSHFFSLAGAALIAALIGATAAYFYNRSLAERQMKWELHQKKLNHIEGICRELMEINTEYWSFPQTNDNLTKFTVFEYKISIYLFEISQFVEQNFDDPDINRTVGGLSGIIAGGPFAVQGRKADPERVRGGAGHILSILQLISEKREKFIR